LHIPGSPDTRIVRARSPFSGGRGGGQGALSVVRSAAARDPGALLRRAHGYQRRAVGVAVKEVRAEATFARTGRSDGEGSAPPKTSRLSRGGTTTAPFSRSVRANLSVKEGLSSSPPNDPIGPNRGRLISSRWCHRQLVETEEMRSPRPAPPQGASAPAARSRPTRTTETASIHSATHGRKSARRA